MCACVCVCVRLVPSPNASGVGEAFGDRHNTTLVREGPDIRNHNHPQSRQSLGTDTAATHHNRAQLSANPSSAPVYHAQAAMQTAAGSADGLMHASLYQVLFNIPKVCRPAGLLATRTHSLAHSLVAEAAERLTLRAAGGRTGGHPGRP